MASLKNIKTKIRAVGKTGQVTKAVEAVSAVKMRKSQTRALAGRAYARAAGEILARVSSSGEFFVHPLALKRPIMKALYIVITSDKGLAGALNSAVLREAFADMGTLGLKPQDISVIAVGRKANEFFGRRSFSIDTFHPNADEVSSELVEKIVQAAADRFASRTVDVVKIAYQNFISTFEQRPTLRIVFPLSLPELQKVVGDIVPARLAHKATAEGGALTHVQEIISPQTYTIEPGEREVLNAIVPKLAGVFVYHALLESQASEHSARMVAMKSASDKALEMSESLTLQFNKARQAMITREVSEITGGMEALV